MTILTIHIPDDKTEFVKKLLQELNIKIEHDEETSNSTPNVKTVQAMKELKAGKGKTFESAKELFSSIS